MPRPFEQTDGLDKPKRLRDVPRYLCRRIGGFCSRLFYIIGIVWESSPPILVLMAAFCLLDGVLPVLGAYVTKGLMDEIFRLLSSGAVSAGDFFADLPVLGDLVFLLALQLLYQFAKKLLSKVEGMTVSLAGERVVNHIRLKIMAKADEVDIRSFDRPDFYEKLENANREAGYRPVSILSATFNTVSAVISVLSFVAVLATLSPVAPLLIVVAAIPGALVTYLYRNKNYQYLRRHSKERRQMNYYSGLMVNKDQAKEVRLLGLGDTFRKRYTRAFDTYYAGIKKLTLKETVSTTAIGLASTVANGLLLLYVAYSVVFGDGGSIGDYSLYTGAIGSIGTFVMSIVSSTAVIYEGTLFINNMIEFMAEPTTVVPSVGHPIVPERGVPHTVEFRGVCFRYPGSDHDVLHDVNLTFSPGQSVVLVGLNGAGKTTLIKLMTRLYDPTAGVILLDGKDLREYDVRALYDLFGIIFQDFGRYAESVSDNIAFGDPTHSHPEGDILRAAKEAGADGFIGRLPDGYQTPLTRMFEENGIELSGGQWQKLSVSRAFFKDSDILILDEPTASLDPLAEEEVFKSFAALAQNKITLFVSHRLSGAVGAGQIVVLDKGRVAEVGTHNELMEKNGIYHLLFSTQAQHYTGEDYTVSQNENEEPESGSGMRTV